MKTVNTAMAKLKGDVANAINESGLPACIVEEIFVNFLNQLHSAAIAQLKSDLKEEEGKAEKDAEEN